MASPISTGGFNVGVMPNVNYLDPRMLAPAYSELVPAMSRGAALGQQFIGIRDDATMRPIRQQLADIQLQEAQNRLSMAPLEQQLAALRLGEAQQQAAVPQFITENIDITGGDRRLAPVDGNAPFADFQITEEYAPRERVTRGREVLAGGEVRPVERRETLATAGDIERRAASDALAAQAEARLGRNQESLAELRTAQAAAATMKAENDRIRADAARMRAELLQNNPAIGFVDVKRADGRTYRQFFQKQQPNKILHEIDRGEIGGDIINFGGLTVSPGAQPLAQSTSPAIDSDVAELAGLAGAGAGAPPSFASEAEAVAAAERGLIQPGQRVVVGGVPGTWQ